MKSSSGAAAPPPPPPLAPLSPVKLKDAADALLYLGPRDSLVGIGMSRAELVGTPYGKETERRLMIEGFPANFISGLKAGNGEAPQFFRPQPGGGSPPVPPPPPKNMGAPLPPRPPSQ